MQYAPPLPTFKSAWLRSVFRLAPLASSGYLIKDFNLSVKKGEVLALVGASGAGKTTLLRIAAGLETVYRGSVVLDGYPIIKPDKRIYLMPQAHTLLPWMSVERNLMFNIRDGDDAGIAEHLLRTFGMSDRRHSYPRSLSGGERARVALMCAMCAKPQVLLLDEPFRGLDQLTKERCSDDLMQWLASTDQDESVVLVSHDIPDAVFLADRVIVIRGGPLGVHAELEISGSKSRRSADIIEREREVFAAMIKVAAEARVSTY